MNIAIKLLGCLLILAIMGCSTTFTNTDTYEPLTLELALEQATDQKLKLVATLTNVSDHRLELNVPVHPSPLTVLVWSTNGHNLTHRISRGLISSHNHNEHIEIVSGEKVVIHAEVDLTKYKDRIKPNEQLFVSAQYGLLQWKVEGNMPSLVYSNKIYLN